jgi:hypothetical protein
MLRPVVFISISMALLSGANAHGQGTPGPSTAYDQTPENLVRMHEAWGAKASTPKASLVIKESTRSGQIIKFQLVADGMPKDGVYSLLAWPVNQKGPSQVLTGVTLDASGYRQGRISAGKQKRGTPEEFPFLKFDPSL